MSFTLTVVVVGVILMTTALTIITLGGASLGDFFNTITGQGEQQVEDRQVRQACERVVNRIQTRYCDSYYNTSTGVNSQKSPTRMEPYYTENCNTGNCPVDVSGGTFDFSYTSEAPGGYDSDYTSIDTRVEVEGSEFNCLDYGLDPVCPVQ